MLTRRNLLLLGFAVTIAPRHLFGAQAAKPQPSDDQLATLTLIIDGMT